MNHRIKQRISDRNALYFNQLSPQDRWRGLAAAVIEQAVDDYRHYERRGLIVNGKVSATNCRTQYFGEFVGASEPEKVVEFFQQGGGMDKLLVSAELGVSGTVIRKNLGIQGTT